MNIHSPLFKTLTCILLLCDLLFTPAFAKPPEHAVAGALHSLRDTLKAYRLLPGQVRKAQTPAALRAEAAKFRDELYQSDAQMLTSFERVVDELRGKKLPPGLRKRHEDTVAQYQRQMGALLEQLNRLSVASDTETDALLAQTLTQLDGLTPAKPPALDPDNLPWRQPPSEVREPFEKKEDFQRLLPRQAVNVASTAITADMLALATGAPNDTDLAESEAVQITPEIQALAASLEHNPVKIFEWVRANIEFIPTYGSVQGSQLTLELKRGNAFDIASLFIALLRASGIHARYSVGTVMADIDKIMRWLDADSPSRAAELMAQGGIPHTVITQGGQIIKMKFEHVWVTMWVDYEPSRGARHQFGDTWHPADAAFKWYDYTPGIDLAETVPFDADGTAQSLLDNVQYDAANGWITGLDGDYIKTVFDDYSSRLDAYLAANNLSSGDTRPGRSVVYPTWAMLPSGLPFQIIAENDAVAELPASLTHSFTFKLYRNATDQALDNPSLSASLNLPRINSKRLSLTWEPATAEDAQALAAYQAEEGRTELPVYLFDLKPVLKLDDEILTEGQAAQMGSAQYYSLNFTDPHFSHGSKGVFTAGDESVIGINGNGLTPAVIEARLAKVDPNASTGSATGVAEQLHQTALHFWAEHDMLDALAAEAYGVRTQRMPSAGIFSAPLSVTYTFGIPRSGNYRERRIDVKHNIQTVASPDAQSRFDFMSQIGIHGSYLEGNVLDQMFGRSYGPAVSAVQVLVSANQSNIPIYIVTAENAATVMPQLLLNADLKEEIQTAVSAGHQVIVPQSDVQIGNWVGAGYIVQDPVTGAGAYLLDGGLNGGTWEDCFVDIQVRDPSGIFRAAIAAFVSLFEDESKSLAQTTAAAAIKTSQITEQFDAAAKAFMTTLNSVWFASGMFKVELGGRCLVAKARSATKYTSSFDDEGFVQKEFVVVLHS